MGWKAFIYDYYLTIDQNQHPNDIDAIVVGPNATGLTNSVTRVVLDPPQWIDAGDWLGRHVIMSGGDNDMIGDVVAGEVLDGNWLNAIDLAHELKSIPTAGQKFYVYTVHGGEARLSDAPSITIEKEIQDISFETTIEEGFGRCTLELNDRAQHLGRLADELPWKYLTIFDPSGLLVYGGIIYSFSLSGKGGSIEALSPRGALGWQYITDVMYAADEWTTPSRVLRDMMQASAYVNYSRYGIDAMDVWRDAVIAAPGGNGIGPLSWADGDYTIKDIVEDILQYGYIHMGSASGYSVFLQIWENLRPVLRIRKRYPLYSDAQYIVTEKNLAENMDGVDIQAGIDRIQSMLFTSYSSEDGDTLRTAAAYAPHYFKKFGPKAEKYNMASESPAVVISSLAAAAKERSLITRPGSISIRDNLTTPYGYATVAPYLLRAGDIVALGGNIENSHTNAQLNRDSATGVFIVGSTSYSVSSGVLTLSILEPLKYRELYSKRVDIKTG